MEHLQELPSFVEEASWLEVERHDIHFHKDRLSKYYSNRKNTQELGKDLEVCVQPKKNLSNFGYG